MTRKFVVWGCLALGLLACKEVKKEPETESPEPVAEARTNVAPAPEIHPVSHATAVVVWDNTTVYVDPVGGAGAFEQFAPADLILITDIHGDHFSAETLQALKTAEARIIAPQAVADQMPAGLSAQVDVLANGADLERSGIVITAIPMYNLREEALDFHTKGRGNGYVLEKNGTRLYFSGDTEDIPEMRALQDIDKAFVCMNLPYTMTVERAADAVLEFKPKQVYPYHYRGRPDVSDVKQFAELVGQGDPGIEVVQLDWYPGEPY